MSSSRLSIFGLCVLLFGLLLFAYSNQLAETEAYVGYRDVEVSILWVVFSTLFLACLIPLRIKLPSDFFLLTYSLFVLYPYMLLYEIRGEVDFFVFLLVLIVLWLPCLLVILLRAIVPPIAMPRLFSIDFALVVISGICIFGIMQTFINAPASAGFDLIGSYDRRLEGRDIYQTGSIAAYLNAMVSNGFAPFLAFFAGWKKKYRYLFIAILCQLVFFYSLGLKAPIAFAFLALLMGVLCRKNKIHGFSIILVGLLLFAFFLFLLEYFYSGHSLVADYFIRRTLTVPPFIMSAYVDYISSSNWDFLTGADGAGPITFMIGEGILGSPGTNANTNAFLYQLTANGCFGYFLVLIFVSLFFALFDSFFKSSRSEIFLYLGFIYSLLLTEQAATVAMVSSGIFFLFVLFSFCKVDSEFSSLTDRREVKKLLMP